VTESSCEIRGGDYEQAGAASRLLKEQLKKIGAAPEILRRAMIAAYEAEMNVVIHAHRGIMRAVLDDQQARVEVIDEGPGIADIERAMTEGYSTADRRARQLGFGAGMGLPNIRRSADRFTLASDVGKGTRLCFTILLKPQADGAEKPNSLHIAAERCTRCLRCLSVCPTGALRVRSSQPQKLDHLCVDCTSCIAACKAGALSVEPTAREAAAARDGVLVIPPAVAAQYAPAWSGADLLDALRQLGFSSVVVTDGAESAFRAAVLEYAATRGGGPILSGVCPAVLNLIETRFPSLIPSVAPLLSPLEAVREEASGRRATFVVLCPAQKTLLGMGAGPEEVDAILPSQLESKVRPLLKPSSGAPPEPAAAAADDPRILRVTGMAHVVRVLEEVENGDLTDSCVLELYACDEGCFGSPLLREDPYVSRRRYRPGRPARPGGRAIPRRTPLQGRPGLRLDSNMACAIQKLAQINRLLRDLPGRDCGLCGGPTCAALAEDIVLGRASADACRRTPEGAR
jgi:anti-sigma regulatory factor (Ser/Thr protein kinase)/Fe-S-cluster-containing hydrogenase component 2